ncbi:MAG: Rne/Rng family ribonuclease [Acidobacteria bacterium]|nr:Rne/Rng family ribonuclease [Acidobacteriota bacterium]
MQKELIISTTPQETKIAILEDDELVEFYIERHRSQGIVGNIYKGKVTKVLPGMQSAFVDIGLERDAFLYVSDFFEDTEEYEKIVSTVEDEVAQLQEVGRAMPPPPPQPQPQPQAAPAAPPALQAPDILVGETRSVPPEGVIAAPVTEERYDDRRGGRRRDRDRRGKKPKIPSFEPKVYERRDRGRARDRDREEERPLTGLEVLPGESLSKYAHRQEQPEKPQEPAEPAPAETSPSDVTESTSVGPVYDRPGADTAPLQDETTQPEDETPESSEALPEDASARITDRSNEQLFAHRPSGRRRPRRGGGGPGPVAPKSDEHRTNGHPPKGGPMISELLREGQEILVQVAKEPLGKKGARITSHIALPGRYLVYMPTVDHVGVSRKIASDEERARLKRIIHENRNGLPGGFIVRTAAEGRGEDEFIQDIRFLGNLWTDIRTKSEKKSAPALIHRDLNLVQRILRDQLTSEYRAIRLDNEGEFATVLDFVNKFQPALVNRVKLHLKDTPIFEEYGLNTEIDKALRSKVWLKSGGYIVINQTEALVAIDVNTGKYVGKSNRLEDTIVRTNLDAVHEIVRQIRLRNLGGIIVVDFIDMEEKKNRQRVMAALEEALRADRSPSKILQFNDFGLVAITRKRTQPSLERTLCKPCPYCNGSGWSKSGETICYEIQQEVKKMAHLLDSREITVRVNPEVAKVLKSGEFVSINELEEWTKKDINVKSDPLLHEEHFDIF